MSQVKHSVLIRFIKCISVLLLIMGCVHPTAVQAYSPKICETIQNSDQTPKKTVSVTAQPAHAKENTLELFVITVLVSILVLFLVGLFHAEHHIY